VTGNHNSTRRRRLAPRKTLLIVYAITGLLMGKEWTTSQSAEIVIEAFTDQTTIQHLTPYLLDIALYGHSLPEDQKFALQQLGFNFSNELVSRSWGTRPEAEGLDRFYDQGIFRFHYTLSGSQAVDSTDNNANSIPDYIDRVSATFNAVADQIINRMGYYRPPGDGWFPADYDNGGSNHYDIYIDSLNASYYGYTQSEYFAEDNGDNEYSSVKENNSITSYIVIRNDYYTGFPNNELENIQVTAAHEFFHAVQFGYDSYEMPWLKEATAVWMEEVIFDDINDCYQYMPSWFQSPHISLDANGDNHWYGSFIYFEYISEHLGGPNTIQRIWDKSIVLNSKNDDYSHLAITSGLAPELSDFSDALNKMVIANRILSSSSQAGIFAYEEAEDYPVIGPATFQTVAFTAGKTMTINSSNLQKYASQYTRIIANTPVQVTLTNTSGPENDLMLHAIMETTTGDYVVKTSSPVNIDPAHGYRWIYLAVVSQKADGTDWDYQLSLDDGVYDSFTTDRPEDFSLANPYPNPFNLSKSQYHRFTNIDVTVSVPQRIKIYIVNLSGRKVANIFNGYLPTKYTPYQFTWTGRNDIGQRVPAGIYLIIAEGKQLQFWKKVTLLK